MTMLTTTRNLLKYLGSDAAVDTWLAYRNGYADAFQIIDAAIAKCNFASTTDPTTGDDSADGYVTGSRWHNTTSHRIFVCEDATLGAAVWRQVWPCEVNYTTEFTASRYGVMNCRPKVKVTADGTVNLISLNSSALIDIADGITNSGYIYAHRVELLRNYTNDGSHIGTQAELVGLSCVYGHYNSYAVSPITTNVYGIYIVPYIKTGTITNMYDLYLAAVQTGGTATNSWGIYQANSKLNYFAGNIYTAGDMSALTFTDRTPAYEGDALGAIKKIKGKDGKIDHTSLPLFARRTISKKLESGEEIEEEGRDIGAMISILTVAVQQLAERLEKLEKVSTKG